SMLSFSQAHAQSSACDLKAEQEGLRAAVERKISRAITADALEIRSSATTNCTSLKIRAREFVRWIDQELTKDQIDILSRVGELRLSNSTRTLVTLDPHGGGSLTITKNAGLEDLSEALGARVDELRVQSQAKSPDEATEVRVRRGN